VVDLRRTGDDSFEVIHEGFEGRSFGGQTLGCAALAAARTVEERALHGLHAWFLRPVPPEIPIALRVERVRDGRRFAHRRVRVEHDERLLCEMLVGCASPGAGAEFQELNVDPGTPAPEDLPCEEDVAREEGWADWRPDALEMRYVNEAWRCETPAATSRYQIWVRPRVPLGEDPGLRGAAMAYLADLHSHWPVVRKLAGDFGPGGFVSLDQVVWVHRDLPWDDWRLVTTESDVAHAGRTLCRRSVHTRDGRLVASMLQEQLIPANLG
jgi:acyl-CoA thioesterase-2